MEEIKLSDDVIEQIKDFNKRKLTKKQKLLIDKLILNEELNKRYKKYGLCKECKQLNTDFYYSGWCQSCNSRRFQQIFKNWTSGNYYIDKFIQNAQLKAKNYKEVLEWIEYDKFENIEYLAKGGFGTTYKAIWKGGNIINWNYQNNQWKRNKNSEVALKCLHNSQNITVEFLKEIFATNNSDRYYGITKDPETNNFMMVMNYRRDLCYECMKPLNTWHQSCNAKRFQQNFKNWTSGNHDVDNFIQNAQLRAKNCKEVLEWIEYDKFENIEYLAKGGFGTTYKAIWKGGRIVRWNYEINQWDRWGKMDVSLKCLHNSQNITVEFLREIFTTNNSDCYYGITKDPETDKFMIVMDYRYGLCYECVKPSYDYDSWSHQSCNAKQFQHNFKNWTSGNHDIDKFIQNAQLKAKNDEEVLEWIKYDRFENIEYLAKREFGTIYKAIWKGGNIIYWNYQNNLWGRDRRGKKDVVLKCLHTSQNITIEFLKEIFATNNSDRYYGITKDPETNNFMMVMNYRRDLCYECMKPYGYDTWCQSCNAKRFQQNFKNWTSGIHDIDKFIQNAQLKTKNCKEVLEWIEYDKFENIEYLAKGEFGTTYKAIWKDGNIVGWNYQNNRWDRYRWGETDVTLKCLHNSQDITVEFLKEIFATNNSDRYYGITKDLETNNFMMVMDYKRDLCYECVKPLNTWHQSCNAKRFQRNFKNWTSGNHDIDKFIQNAQLRAKNCKEVLEWVEYDGFENIEYVAKGGFGTIYRAIWKDGSIVDWNYQNNQWKRNKNSEVALKCLHTSQNITVEFLKEIESHLITINSYYIVRCHGISKDPVTNDFIMVMEYVNNGNLRQYLDNSFISLNWSAKLLILWNIASGLDDIHDNRLIHHDFHCGNILNNVGNIIYITDLGLCRPVNAKYSPNDSKKIYGVLPYVAPEVLKGKKYTQASDIYGFGIITYEVCTGFPPYHNIAHDEFLAIRICQGLRPESNYKIPQLILDIIKQCWDADPLKRPTAKELVDLLHDLYSKFNNKNSLINGQIKEADETNNWSSSSSEIFSYTTHPQSVYTSRLLDFKNLPEPKNADDNDNLLEPEYSESMAMDFTKLKRLNSEDESSEKNKKQKI